MRRGFGSGNWGIYVKQIIFFRFVERSSDASIEQDQNFVDVNKEFYDFMWQKMGSIAGSLQVGQSCCSFVVLVLNQMIMHALK